MERARNGGTHMAKYTLYVDHSKESGGLEKELDDRGVSFVRVHHESGGKVLPALTGPEGVYEGTANIKLYFLDRRFVHSRA
jgi:hypothetical protein